VEFEDDELCLYLPKLNMVHLFGGKVQFRQHDKDIKVKRESIQIE